MEQLNKGLNEIFSTILKDAGESKSMPAIIVVSGNGHVIAPGGTVHVHRSTEPVGPRTERFGGGS